MFSGEVVTWHNLYHKHHFASTGLQIVGHLQYVYKLSSCHSRQSASHFMDRGRERKGERGKTI